MFDPTRISYPELLEVAWTSHDPCRAPWSRQYKAAIFCHDEAQKKVALETREAIETARGARVETEILDAVTFYPAEDYHQKFMLRNRPEFLAEIERAYPDPEEFVLSTAAARLNGYLGGHGTIEALEREIDLLGLSGDRRRSLRELLRGKG